MRHAPGLQALQGDSELTIPEMRSANTEQASMEGNVLRVISQSRQSSQEISRAIKQVL